MKTRTTTFALCLTFALTTAAQGRDSHEIPTEVTQLNDSLKQRYAPDSRVALFDVDYTFAGRCVMLRGNTTSPQAHAALVNGLHQAGYQVMDCLNVLPDSAALEGKTYGIVNLSVCNLHAEADFASEMVTQGLMGMPVRVLEQDGWYRIQTPDRYIAWVHRAGIVPVTQTELEAWNQAEKIVVTAHYGTVADRPTDDAQPISDVVAGDRLKWTGEKGRYYHVTYPDGRSGYLHKSAGMPEKQWRKQLKQQATDILHTAHSLMGVPYLWAGTSSKGVDCSGFIRTVLYMHDILLPRDASQQAYVGQRIDIAPDLNNLQAGDLLFFGRKATANRRERVVHVGMYMGNGQFIHSQGNVHISSLLPDDEHYDAFNHGRLLFATRFLPYINKVEGIETTDRHPLYSTNIQSHTPTCKAEETF